MGEECSLFFNYWMRFTELEDHEGRLKNEEYIPTILKNIRGTLVEFLTYSDYEKLRQVVIHLAPSKKHGSHDQEMVCNLLKSYPIYKVKSEDSLYMTVDFFL